MATVWHVFLSKGIVKKLHKGDVVYRSGDTPEGLYFVEDGLVGLTFVSETGSEHFLRFFKKGQFFGHRSLLAKESYHATAICLEPTELKFIPRNDILQMLKSDPDLALGMAERLAKELGQSELQRIQVTDSEVLQRVAWSVVYLKEIHPDHRWTRQEIAQFCASTTSTVIRVLAELEQRGYIQQESREIKVLDRQALLNIEHS